MLNVVTAKFPTTPRQRCIQHKMGGERAFILQFAPIRQDLLDCTSTYSNPNA